MAQFYAGIPHTVPLATLNRQVRRRHTTDTTTHKTKQTNHTTSPVFTHPSARTAPPPPQCSSGLQAFINVAAAIQAGVLDVGIAGGVESMSLTDMASSVPEINFERVAEHQDAKDCTIPMGATSDEVASRFRVSRQEQDAFAARSHEKAERARASGRFKEEIVPVRPLFCFVLFEKCILLQEPPLSDTRTCLKQSTAPR